MDRPDPLTTRMAVPMPPESREWEALAPFWIERCRAGESNRAGMLDAWMLRVLGDVAGLHVIDLGCGEGRFCRMLAQRSAHVLGVDLCRPLLEAARQASRSDRERYLLGDMQQLDEVPGAIFDLAVSYVSLVDVPDLDRAVAEAARVLKPGGRFVVSNLAPMATATNARLAEADGARIALRVDQYFDEATRVMHFGRHHLTNYHRTLTTYLNTFIGAGFLLRGFFEPYPTEEGVERYPKLANELRAPSFVLFDLEKAG